MNNLIKLAVLASLAAVLPASATWVNLSTCTYPCTPETFTELLGSASTRFVNDYGTVDSPTTTGTGNNFTGRTSQSGSQLVGWFAAQGTTVANGGNGQIIDTSTPYNSTVRTSNSLPMPANTTGAAQSGLMVAGPTTDEAIGTSASGSNIAFGVGYRNDTGRIIDTLQVSYRGEQWRNSGASAQSLEVSYAVFGSNDLQLSLDMDPDVAPGGATTWDPNTVWRSAGGLSTFTSPITGGSAGALDGNLAANSRTLSFNLSNLQIPLNGFVVIRWRDIDDAGVTDHILAVDDVCVAIPEPSTYAAIIALGAIGTSVWRSRRRSAKA